MERDQTTMCADITRRDLLKAAGGLTFLALVPAGRGRLEPALGAPRRELPLFTALPYVQPGNNSRLVQDEERMVLAWQTDANPADFTSVRTDRPVRPRKPGDGLPPVVGRCGRWRIAAQLHGRVSRAPAGHDLSIPRAHGPERIAEGYFTTRKPRGAPTRFVAFGDNSYGDISDRAIAFQAYQARPDFVMNTGDNVYDGGLDNEYARFFFPVYNADAAGPRIGAPLLRSVPFYTVIANHDVHREDGRQHPVADFDAGPGFAGAISPACTCRSTPRCTPSRRRRAASRPGSTAFQACAGSRFPRMANYSFDYGDAHFLCLDSNLTSIPPTPRWQRLDRRGPRRHGRPMEIRRVPPPSLQRRHRALHRAAHAGARAAVRAARRGRSSSMATSTTTSGRGPSGSPRRDRRRGPAEREGSAGAGHIHRGHRLRRRARDPPGRGALHHHWGGRQATLRRRTSPAPRTWRRPEDGNVEYVVRLVADRHSLTVVDVQPTTLRLRQIDEHGQEIDRIRITKA